MFKRNKVAADAKPVQLKRVVLPEFTDWQLFFRKEDGPENRIDVMRAFIDFVIDPKGSDMSLPGFCMIGGKIFGHNSYDDGETIITSCVESIFKVDQEIMKCQKQYTEEENFFLIGFITRNGRMYYLDYRKMNPFMNKLENDFLINRKLSEEPGHYMPPQYKNREFL